MKKYKIFILYLWIFLTLIFLKGEEYFPIYYGFIDRIEEKTAVILIESLHIECHISLSSLPLYIKEQSWVTVYFNSFDETCVFHRLENRRKAQQYDKINRMKQELSRGEGNFGK